MNRVIKFDVSSMQPEDIERFYGRLQMLTFLTDVILDPSTNRIGSIRAFFDTNIDVSEVIRDFDNVTYKDITGTNLMNP